MSTLCKTFPSLLFVFTALIRYELNVPTICLRLFVLECYVLFCQSPYTSLVKGCSSMTDNLMELAKRKLEHLNVLKSISTEIVNPLEGLTSNVETLTGIGEVDYIDGIPIIEFENLDQLEHYDNVATSLGRTSCASFNQFRRPFRGFLDDECEAAVASCHDFQRFKTQNISRNSTKPRRGSISEEGSLKRRFQPHEGLLSVKINIHPFHFRSCYELPQEDISKQGFSLSTLYKQKNVMLTPAPSPSTSIGYSDSETCMEIMATEPLGEQFVETILTPVCSPISKEATSLTNFSASNSSSSYCADTKRAVDWKVQLNTNSTDKLSLEESSTEKIYRESSQACLSLPNLAAITGAHANLVGECTQESATTVPPLHSAQTPHRKCKQQPPIKKRTVSRCNPFGEILSSKQVSKQPYPVKVHYLQDRYHPSSMHNHVPYIFKCCNQHNCSNIKLCASKCRKFRLFVKCTIRSGHPFPKLIKKHLEQMIETPTITENAALVAASALKSCQTQLFVPANKELFTDTVKRLERLDRVESLGILQKPGARKRTIPEQTADVSILPQPAFIPLLPLGARDKVTRIENTPNEDGQPTFIPLLPTVDRDKVAQIENVPNEEGLQKSRLVLTPKICDTRPTPPPKKKLKAPLHTQKVASRKLAQKKNSATTKMASRSDLMAESYRQSDKASKCCQTPIQFVNLIQPKKTVPHFKFREPSKNCPSQCTLPKANINGKIDEDIIDLTSDDEKMISVDLDSNKNASPQKLWLTVNKIAPALKIEKNNERSDNGCNTLGFKPIQYAVMCSNVPSLGFLRLQRCTGGKLLLHNPAKPKKYRIFDNVEVLNNFLNGHLKPAVVLDSELLPFKWVLVTLGVVEVKNILPFNTKMWLKPHQFVISKSSSREMKIISPSSSLSKGRRQDASEAKSKSKPIFSTEKVLCHWSPPLNLLTQKLEGACKNMLRADTKNQIQRSSTNALVDCKQRIKTVTSQVPRHTTNQDLTSKAMPNYQISPPSTMYETSLPKQYTKIEMGEPATVIVPSSHKKRLNSPSFELSPSKVWQPEKIHLID